MYFPIWDSRSNETVSAAAPRAGFSPGARWRFWTSGSPNHLGRRQRALRVLRVPSSAQRLTADLSDLFLLSDRFISPSVCIYRLNCESESFNYGPQQVFFWFGFFLPPGCNKEVVMSNISSELTGASAVLREKKRPTVCTC